MARITSERQLMRGERSGRVPGGIGRAAPGAVSAGEAQGGG
jgi:hypothetical protein